LLVLSLPQSVAKASPSAVARTGRWPVSAHSSRDFDLRAREFSPAFQKRASGRAEVVASAKDASARLEETLACVWCLSLAGCGLEEPRLTKTELRQASSSGSRAGSSATSQSAAPIWRTSLRRVGPLGNRRWRLGMSHAWWFTRGSGSVAAGLVCGRRASRCRDE